MTTLPILVGFALMLFLPCAIAVFSSRDREEDSANSDRTVAPVGIRLTEPVPTAAPLVLQAVFQAEAKPTRETPGAGDAVYKGFLQAEAESTRETPEAVDAVYKGFLTAATIPTREKSESRTQTGLPDPMLPVRAMKFHKAIILRNEIEAIVAAAVAARAQAGALAANARLAAARAEAADAEALAAEELATAAIHEIQRAA